MVMLATLLPLQGGWMRLNLFTLRVISLFLVGTMLFSCARYSYYELPKQPTPTFEGRTLRLYYPEKPNECYMFGNLKLTEQELSGTIYRPNAQPDGRDSNEISAYLRPGLVIPDSMLSDYRLNLSDINRMEVYDLNLGKSIIITTFSAVGIAFVAATILFLVALLTKESCPFIFCHNGEEFEFTGEIYSGAIFPNLERDDYLALTCIQPKDGFYQIRMDNLAEEIQYTNFAELEVVDHPLGSSVFVDRKGKYHTIRQAVAPLKAQSGTNEDVLNMLTARDEHKFCGDDLADKNSPYDALELQFAKPKGANNAKLVLKARNSIWLDKTLGQFLDMFGSSYDKWYARQSKPDKSLDPDWALKQGIPLSVYAKKNGAWQFIDYFPVVGPMAECDLVLPIDLSEIDGDNVELRLQCGAKFWEIDYAAMDFSASEPIHTKKIAVDNAITTEGVDIAKLVAKRDDKYFVQPRVGDSALLQYKVPPAREGMQRSVFLSSRGHYKVIRKAKGEPDIARLEQFRNPGSFAAFSRNNYLEFLAKYSLLK